MFDKVLTNYLTEDFWPGYFFVNEYPVLSVVWNFFLACVPLIFYYHIKRISVKNVEMTFFSRLRIYASFLLWLLFLPNSAYIVTEIRHLSGLYNSISVFNRQMYDVWIIIFFFAYSIIGYFIFYYSVEKMLGLLKDKFYADRRIFLPIIIFFSALGVLIGLVGRWNSWEVFFSPSIVFADIAKYFLDWYYFRNLLIYFIFYYLMHLAISACLDKVRASAGDE